MGNITRILMATDLSEASTSARDLAVALARQHKAELHVLYVQVLLEEKYAWTADVPAPDNTQQKLANTCQTVLSEFVADIEIPVIQATAKDVAAGPAILRYAQQHAIDLIVVGTHSRAGLSRLFLGSVAAEVVRTAPIPVITVGAAHTPASNGFRCILSALDFSESSRSALQYAAQLAVLPEPSPATPPTKMIALHVVETLALPPYYLDKFVEMGRAHARTMLQEFVEDSQLPVSPEILVSAGQAHLRIAELAKEFNADLIVLSTHGLRGLDRFLLGSVTDRVIRSAPCPVLAYRDAAPEKDQ